MRTQYPQVAIIALNYGSITEEVSILQDALGVNVKPINGCWNGEQEQSYVVTMPDSPCPVFKAKLVHLAQICNQECFFVLLSPTITGRRRCISFHAEDFHHAVQEGYFVPCTQSKAYKQAGWTFDANTGQHYILEEN